MIVHKDEESVLVDFFVEAPGREGSERGEELVPIDVRFDESTTQVFRVGAASCGVPGTAAGLSAALERFGTMPMEALIGPAVRYAREGAPINHQQAYVLRILEPIYTRLPECRAIYAPEGRILGEGEAFRFPDLANGLELLAAEGPGPFYDGELGSAVADFVRERGGILSRSDMAAYRPIERQPVSASYRSCRILTNPPPSSGGILIAYALELLERAPDEGIEALVGVMGAANQARGERFSEGLYREGFGGEFLSVERLGVPLPRLGPAAVGEPGERFGSTTHLVVIDAGGVCASVTCSNGTGSGLVVPGTGIHVNNMLGEEDLNPHGFHRTPAGRRITSMMAPTIVLRDDEVIAGLGSAGSNRIRSAVLQTVVRLLADGMGPSDAVAAPRVHYEEGSLQAEPGVDERGLRRVEAAGVPVVRWRERNLFFGGVQAVTRDPSTGVLEGGGDPRRGGSVAHA
jgi:gamma-glutamyltranspeptidase / glutathione hydrolase